MVAADVGETSAASRWDTFVPAVPVRAQAGFVEKRRDVALTRSSHAFRRGVAEDRFLSNIRSKTRAETSSGQIESSVR